MCIHKLVENGSSMVDVVCMHVLHVRIAEMLELVCAGMGMSMCTCICECMCVCVFQVRERDARNRVHLCVFVCLDARLV